MDRVKMSRDAMVVQRVTVGGRYYEQRLVRCGKENCSRCNGGTKPPGHGPYWYLVVTKGPRTRRIYLGKDLDTRRYVDQEGRIDWRSVERGKQEGAPAAAPVGRVEQEEATGS